MGFLRYSYFIDRLGFPPEQFFAFEFMDECVLAVVAIVVVVGMEI